MNWVDLVILTLLLLFALEGLGRKFLPEFLDFISFIFAFVFSLSFYSYISVFYETNFKIPHSFSVVLGFITTWFLVEFLISILGNILLRFLSKSEFFNIPDVLTIIPAFLRGFVFISILLIFVGTFPIQPLIKRDVLDSKIGSKILSYAQSFEAPLKSIFGGVTQDTLTFLTIKPQSDKTVDLGFKTSQFQPSKALEEEMISLVNSERKKRGLNTLEFDVNLRETGRVHSKDMFERGYFSHYSPEGESVADRAQRQGISYLIIGENLAYAPSLEIAHDGLMNSEGHRANILSDSYNKIGIGIMDGGIYGLMITQVFSN